MADTMWLSVGLGPNSTSVDLMAMDTGFMLRDTLNMGTEGSIRFDMLVRGLHAGQLGTRVGDVNNLLAQAPGRVGRPHDEWITLTIGFMDAGVTHYLLTGGDAIPDEPHPSRQGVVLHFDLDAMPDGLLEPVVFAQTGNMSNGAIKVAIPALDVGDRDALLRVEVEDTSTSGYIAHITGTMRSGEGITTSDWDAIVDAPTLGGSNTTDTGASIGDAYATRAVTGAWATVAQATIPSGAHNRALRDVWARVKSTATGLTFGSNPTATVQAPVATTTDVTEATTVYAAGTVAVVDGRNAPTTNVSPVVSLSQTILTASAGLAVTRAYTPGGTVTGSGVVSPSGSGWRKITSATVGNYEYAAWIKPHGVSQGANPNVWTFDLQSNTGSKPHLAVMQANCAGTVALDGFTFDISDTDTAFISLGAGSTRYDNTLVVSMIALEQHTNSGSVWTEGATETYDTNGLLVGSRVAEDAGGDSASGVVLETVTGSYGAFVFALRGVASAGTRVVSSSTTTVYPGTLAAGSRSYTVYPVDAGGKIGTGRTSSSPVVTAVDGSTNSLNWPDPAAGTVHHWIVQWSFNGRTYRVYTPDAVSEYVITGESDAIDATSLPALTTGQAADNLVRISSGQTTGALWDGVPERVPSDGVWRWVLLGTAVELPPGGRLLGGEYADGRVVVSGLSGGGASPTLQVDALWMPAHHEPSWFAEYPGMAGPGAAGNVWVMESDLWGMGSRGWLRTTGGTPAGALLVAGPILAASGDSVLSLLCQGANGVATLAGLQVKVTVTVWPRVGWIGGGA